MASYIVVVRLGENCPRPSVDQMALLREAVQGGLKADPPVLILPFPGWEIEILPLPADGSQANSDQCVGEGPVQQAAGRRWKIRPSRLAKF
jgi:hypothetical protein